MDREPLKAKWDWEQLARTLILGAASLALVVISIVLAALVFTLMSGTARGAQPADAMMSSYANVLRIPKDKVGSGRDGTRYIWVSEESKEMKWATFVAVSAHLNALSVRSRRIAPVLVLNDGTERVWPKVLPQDWPRLTLLRFNIYWYGWSKAVYERLGNPDLEPFFHVWVKVPYPAGNYKDGTSYAAGEERVSYLAPWLFQPLPLPQPDAKYVQATVGLCIECGYTTVPVLEASNFIWQTAIQFDRKAGYYDFIGVKNLKDFERLVGFDREKSLAFSYPLLEAIPDSGVANQARRYEGYPALGGRLHVTKDQLQRGIRNRNPLNVLGKDDLTFDVFEFYGMGANGFWKNLLADKNGVRQDSAPDGVGYNKFSVTNDGKIHIYLACYWCHDKVPGNGGLQPFRPYFRNLWATDGPAGLPRFTEYAKSHSKVTVEELEDEYLSDMDFTADQQTFIKAVLDVTGTTPDKYSLTLVELFYQWEKHVDLETSAARSGVSVEVYVEALGEQHRLYGELDNVTTNWRLVEQRRSRIGVDQWTESYNLQQLALRGYPRWPDAMKQRFPVRPSDN